jgi:hypothetical protein
MRINFPSIERLGRKLQMYGFNHSYDIGHFEIGFSRPSVVPRVFEHLHVCGQGKYSNVLYAMTALSAIKHFVDDECISIRDLDLMFVLERDADRHWTEIRNSADRVEWEQRLVHAADEACRRTSQKLGDQLTSSISHARNIADKFIEYAGDLSSVLDREFAFLTETLQEHQERIKVWAWGRTDDQVLACHVFFRFVTEVDSSLLGNCDCRLGDNDSLRCLMHLLADHIADCREKFYG